MHQIQPDDLSLLEPFFNAVPANDAMLRAFLAGRVPGQAFVDRMPGPRAAVVAVNYRFVFFGGLQSRLFHERAIRQLRFQHPLDVVWRPQGTRMPCGPAPDEVVTRVEFRRRENRGARHLDTLAAGIPAAAIKRIDADTIRRCLWREDVLQATGSTSEFLGHGLGFCLMIKDAIVAEAYAVIWSGDRAEIATVTHPRHRGRGYATALCASLIKACEAVGLSTYWNCDAANAPSLQLAARLGYSDPHSYRIVKYGVKAPGAGRVRARPRTLGGLARRLFGRVGGRR